MLLSAGGPHARKITFERMAAPNFQAFPSVVLRKRDASAIQRLGITRVLLGAQFQSLALHTNRRRDNAPAIADGTRTRNLVKNVVAARINILRKHELNG